LLALGNGTNILTWLTHFFSTVSERRWFGQRKKGRGGGQLNSALIAESTFLLHSQTNKQTMY
jgi:hypothetical protein